MTRTGTAGELSAAGQLEEELGPKIPHLDGCPAERIEVYENQGPRGYVVVCRCIDCAAYYGSRPTEDRRIS